MATARKVAIVDRMTDSAATYYTTPVNVDSRITAFVLTNTSTTTVGATVHLVPSGSSVTDDNIIMDDKRISPGATVQVPGAIGQTLEEGDTIQAFAGTTEVIAMRASVAETAL